MQIAPADWWIEGGKERQITFALSRARGIFINLLSSGRGFLVGATSIAAELYATTEALAPSRRNFSVTPAGRAGGG